MRIQTLQATNFKGSKTIDLYCAPVTIITGDNFTGKTSRIEALQLALGGYVPGVEATPAQIHNRLASGPTLAVEVVLDSGASVKRAWTKGKGVQLSERFDGLPEGWKCDPVVIDAQTFLGLSGKAKTSYLFKLCKLTSELSGKTVIDRVKKCVTMTGDTAEVIMAKINGWGATITARLTGAMPQEWLQSLAEECRQWKLKTEQALREKDASLETTGAALGRMKRTNKSEVQQHLDALRASLAVMDFEHGEMRSTYERAFAWANAMRAKHGNDPRPLKELKADGSNLSKKITALEDGCKGANAEELASQVRKAQEKAAAATIERRGAETALNSSRNELHLAGVAIESLTKERCCPVCKRSAKGWQNEALKFLQERKEQCESLVESAQKVHAEAEALELQSKAAYVRAEEALAAHNNAVAAVFRTRKELAVIDEIISGKEAEALVNSHKTTMANLTAKREAIMADITTASADLEEALKVELLEQALKTLNAETAVLNSELEVAKGASKAVGQILEEATNAAVGALMEPMNKIARGILDGVYKFEDGELSIQRGEETIPFKAFSGAERALTCCAVSVALAPADQMKIVVLDEMDRFDPENKKAIAERALSLVLAGDIDQAFLVGVSPDGYGHLPSSVKGRTAMTLCKL